MADIYSDDDPDAAAMAEAMGFTGFGMQRNKKRKQPDPPSQTGANNAPLGKRRLPMNLPKPVVSGSGGGGADGNPEEIDLDDDDDDGDGEGGVDVGTAGGVDGDEGEAVVSERAAALTVDDDPSIPVHQQHHHSLPPRPQHQHHQQQQQQQNHHHGAPRPGGRGHGGQTPWWEGTWDPRLISRIIENPWDRLEKQRGLEARGTWPSPAAARGSGGPAPAAAYARDNDNEGVEDMGSSAGAATAKA